MGSARGRAISPTLMPSGWTLPCPPLQRQLHSAAKVRFMGLLSQVSAAASKGWSHLSHIHTSRDSFPMLPRKEAWPALPFSGPQGWHSHIRTARGQLYLAVQARYRATLLSAAASKGWDQLTCSHVFGGLKAQSPEGYISPMYRG